MTARKREERAVLGMDEREFVLSAADGDPGRWAGGPPLIYFPKACRRTAAGYGNVSSIARRLLYREGALCVKSEGYMSSLTGALGNAGVPVAACVPSCCKMR